jgi:hypothetical protein
MRALPSSSPRHASTTNSKRARDKYKGCDRSHRNQESCGNWQGKLRTGRISPVTVHRVYRRTSRYGVRLPRSHFDESILLRLLCLRQMMQSQETPYPVSGGERGQSSEHIGIDVSFSTAFLHLLPSVQKPAPIFEYRIQREARAAALSPERASLVRRTIVG